MKVFCFLLVIGVALALPTGDPQQNAEVIRVVDEKTPIVIVENPDVSENALVQPKSNETVSDSSSSSSAPTPIPDNVALTTEKVPENTPALVPSVVDISTVPPSTPPAPAVPSNSTSTDNDEDEEDSDETENSNEEEEDDEEDDDEEEEEEDEADEEEEADEEDEEDDDAAKRAKSKKPVKKSRSVRDVNGEEIPSSFKEGETDKSEEEVIAAASAPVALNKLSQGSKLQGVDGKAPTNEDDEAESALINVAQTKPSIIL